MGGPGDEGDGKSEGNLCEQRESEFQEILLGKKKPTHLKTTYIVCYLLC